MIFASSAWISFIFEMGLMVTALCSRSLGVVYVTIGAFRRRIFFPLKYVLLTIKL